MEKGEFAHYEQFLRFPVFSKDLHCRDINTRACLEKGLDKAFLNNCEKRRKC